MIFYNFSHNIFYVESCRAHLLRDEAGGGHSRCGVDFKHVYFLSFGDDVVHGPVPCIPECRRWQKSVSARVR